MANYNEKVLNKHLILRIVRTVWVSKAWQKCLPIISAQTTEEVFLINWYDILRHITDTLK